MSHGYCIDNEKLDKLVHPVVKTVPDWHLAKSLQNSEIPAWNKQNPSSRPPFYCAFAPWSRLDAYACVILSTGWNYRPVLYVTHAWLESGVTEKDAEG